MAKYTPTSFKDRDVTYGDRYRVQQVSGTTFTIDTGGSVQGTVNEAGTGYGQALNNNQEDGISSANNSRRSDRMNLLSDAVALCEDGSLFTNAVTTDTDDTDNAKFGKSAVKVTLTGSQGTIYKSIFASIDITKYYMVSGHVKNNDLSGSGTRIYLIVSGGTNQLASYSTATDFTRQGVILQPSDMSGASDISLYAVGDGASGEDFWLDGLSLIEITASEYAEGATALLAKFPFTYSKGQDSYTEINTLGADTVVCSGRLLSESQGLTDVNLLNDDVAGLEVTTDWTDSSGASSNDSSNELEGTNCRKFTLSASSGFTYQDFLAKLDTSKYYLISGHVKNGDATSVYLSVNCVGDAGLLNNTAHTGTTYLRQGIAIQPSDFNGASEVRVQIIALGANTEFVYADALMIQEITAEEYNAETDPENVITLLKKYDYHRGLGSCEALRLKSVGKNLFNSFSSTNTFSATHYSDANTSFSSSRSTDDVLWAKIKADDKNYTVSFLNSGTTADFDGVLTNVDVQNSSDAIVETVTSGSNISESGTTFDNTSGSYKYLVLSFRTSSTSNLSTIKEVMAEKGSSATAYESYKESISYTPRVLRSVPNGTRDTFRHNDGVYTQNCEEHVLLSGDIDSVANGTNLQRVNIGVDALDGLITQTGGTITGEIVISGTIGETTGNDIAGDDYKFTAGATLISMLFPLGTYADVAAARTALTSTVTTKIVYELATPVVTYHPENIVNGYPNGTVYHEKAVEEVLIYDNGLVASNSDLLVNSMDYAYKIDTATNVETPVDLDNVITDGVQYTLLSGDIDSLVTSGSNVDYVTIGLDAFSVVKTQTSGIDGSFAIPNYNTETIVALDTAGNEQKFRTTATILYLMFTKGTYADIAAARVALAGLKLVYESTSKTDTIGIIGASVGELYRFAYYYFGTGTRGLASYGYCQNSKDESEGNTEGLKELNNKVNLNKNILDQAVLQSDATAQGDILYADADYSITNLAKGTAYQHLGINSGATAPEWQESANSVLTAQGDLLYADAANSLVRLAKGTAYQSLLMNSGATAPSWGVTSANGTTSENTSVAATSTYTKTVALGFTATSAHIIMKADDNEGNVVICNATSSSTYSAYVSDDASTNSRVYTGNTQLSQAVYSACYLKAAYIDGTDLKIEFYNPNGTSETVIFSAQYTAWV